MAHPGVDTPEAVALLWVRALTLQRQMGGQDRVLRLGSGAMESADWLARLGGTDKP